MLQRHWKTTAKGRKRRMDGLKMTIKRQKNTNSVGPTVYGRGGGLWPLCISTAVLCQAARVRPVWWISSLLLLVCPWDLLTVKKTNVELIFCFPVCSAGSKLGAAFCKYRRPLSWLWKVKAGSENCLVFLSTPLEAIKMSDCPEMNYFTLLQKKLYLSK